MLAGWALMLVSHDVSQFKNGLGIATIPKGFEKAGQLQVRLQNRQWLRRLDHLRIAVGRRKCRFSQIQTRDSGMQYLHANKTSMVRQHSCCSSLNDR
jgi:hypothetical protein